MENVLELTDLNFNELVEIDGGHQAAAYEAGHYLGKLLIAIAMFW
jgi:Cft2 family RNA processing exonuclease